ncbi:DNA cytosine methyltransferase [Metabacillus herbersteinensis]
MNQVLKKVYTISQKGESPRVWLQSLVLEAAGIAEGDPLYINIDEENEEITVQNHSLDDAGHLVHASGRLNKTSNKRRPLLDSAKKEYASIISIKQKVEVCVYRKGLKSRIVIRPLHFKLMENCTQMTPKDDRIKILSVGAGCGIGSGALIDTKYFTAVQEIELEDDSAEVLKHNYPNSFLFNGDIRDCHEVAKSDIALVTLPCNQFSTLGNGDGSVIENLVLAAFKIIKSSQSKIVFFENVPAFFTDPSWHLLKDLLKDDYPYFAEKNIEAWDFKSIATRNRTYVVAFKEFDMFTNFQFPAPPKGRRKKLKNFLDGKHVVHEWKSIETWMTNFEDRDSSWRDRNLDKTFVDGECQQINCLPKRYRGQSASSSYVLSEDKKSWRFLSENEIRRILDVPSWFEFCDHTPVTRRIEMLGQSVSCQVIKAIGNNIATTFLRQAYKKTNDAARVLKEKVEQAVSITTNGQLELLL